MSPDNPFSGLGTPVLVLLLIVGVTVFVCTIFLLRHFAAKGLPKQLAQQPVSDKQGRGCGYCTNGCTYCADRRMRAHNGCTNCRRGTCCFCPR